MRKHTRGWLILLAAVAMLAAAALLDEVVVRSGEVAYCPDNAAWVVAAVNLPYFYEQVLRTDLAKALNEQAPDYQAEWQLAIRKQAGIRPTPQRWRVWLGRRVFAAVSEDGWGACVRPGILLRIADTLRAFGGWRPAVRQYGPWYYAWRNGALIFSKSEQYVLASIASQPRDAKTYLDPKLGSTLAICEGLDARFALMISPLGPQVYVQGWLDRFEVSRAEPDIAQWPAEETLLWASAPRCADLRKIVSFVGSKLNSKTSISAHPWVAAFRKIALSAVEQWQDKPLPETWDDHVAQCSIALLGVDDSEPLPVPEMGLVLHSKDPLPGSHPLEPLISSVHVLPYEWDGRPGVIATRAGEKAAICLSTSGSDWLAASQERAMAALIKAVKQPGVKCDGARSDALVALNWRKFAALAQSLAFKAAKLELFPNMSSADIEKTVLPLVRALAEQGNAHLHLFATETRGQFYGTLNGGACR